MATNASTDDTTLIAESSTTTINATADGTQITKLPSETGAAPTWLIVALSLIGFSAILCSGAFFYLIHRRSRLLKEGLMPGAGEISIVVVDADRYRGESGSKLGKILIVSKNGKSIIGGSDKSDDSVIKPAEHEITPPSVTIVRESKKSIIEESIKTVKSIEAAKSIETIKSIKSIKSIPSKIDRGAPGSNGSKRGKALSFTLVKSTTTKKAPVSKTNNSTNSVKSARRRKTVLAGALKKILNNAKKSKAPQQHISTKSVTVSENKGAKPK